MRIADILAQPTGYDRIQFPAIAHVAVAEDRADELDQAIAGHPRIRILAREQAGDVVILSHLSPDS